MKITDRATLQQFRQKSMILLLREITSSFLYLKKPFPHIFLLKNNKIHDIQDANIAFVKKPDTDTKSNKESFLNNFVVMNHNGNYYFYLQVQPLFYL